MHTKTCYKTKPFAWWNYDLVELQGHQHQIVTRVWVLCSSDRAVHLRHRDGVISKPCYWYLQHKKSWEKRLWELESQFLFFQWSLIKLFSSVLSILTFAPTFSFIISCLRYGVRVVPCSTPHVTTSASYHVYSSSLDINFSTTN